MLTQQQLDKFTTKDEILKEIKERQELQFTMVGWLYPTILQTEIEQLQERVNKMNTNEVSKKAYQLLEESDCWTQDYFAIDKNGNGTWSCSPDGVKFCLHGIVKRAYQGVGDKYIPEADKVIELTKKLNDYTEEKFGLSYISWNDQKGRTKQEVVAVLKELDI